jgi:hypothetical protein
LNSSVRGLTNPGPTQDQFVQNVNASLQTDTVPMLEHEASATITEIQPEVKASILKLRDQVPDLAQATEDQVRLLQKDLPEKGEAVLNRRFATLVTSREASIRKMYPEVTDAQFKALLTTLTDHARTQLIDVNTTLFAPHQAKVQSILASMDTIKSQEAANVKNDQPDWEMGVLLLDVFRDDLTNLAHSDSKSPSSKSPAPAHPAATVAMTTEKGK